ncbi:non-ribosomal peptide synthetase [Mycolicibacter minnesotensis]|uniref:Non-ribosomal peptide synthetase n=2 Tax=Mycobacteriaceae TaxID=1762 RepID=A0A7I7R647_9MYCO|nr:non-ribosomal peptide synthetase [Mycolicibacter minnesotensis]ORB03853.1 non-ribosomal peptide synthetase [Mycolicibacter minnesotensis]BBY34133.1 hypothetical protein MMIN_21940 [Mycolicibacter minnesotensis]
MTDRPDVPSDIASLSPEKKRELLAQLLMAKAQDAASEHELSYGQRSMWFMHRLAPDSAAYTVAYAGRITGGLDLPALERAAQALVDRHPMLRTTYTERDGQPVALVHAHWPLRIATHRIGADAAELDQWVQAEIDRPFDLRTGPVLRLTLLQRPDDQVLLLTVHHIAVDFWSIDIILDELRSLYASEHGADGPEATADRYVDYAGQQAQMLAGPDGERLWEYWREELRGELPTLALPTDRPRPAVQTYDGALHRFSVDAAVTAGIKQVARTVGATPYMTLLAAYAVLLHRYSGQEDLVIGSPFACRDRAGLMGMVGYVTNPLPLRVDLAGDPSFAALLGQVKDTVLGAIGHQEYPLPLLVERLRPVRDAARTPLFQVSFAWQQVRLFDEDSAGAASDSVLHLETLYIGQGGSPFDITMQVGEQGPDDARELQVALQYNTDLFDAATIEAMGQHFALLLTGLAQPGAADAPVSALNLLTEAERATIASWNDTAVDYAVSAEAPPTLDQMVAASAARTPDAVAVSYDGRDVSYGELDRRANGLAHRLRQFGVGTGPGPAVVPVLMERSEDLVIALLGVLKAGGVFLPLDPAQPVGRLEAMLADIPDAPVCVTHRAHLSHVPPGFTGARLCLDQSSTAPAEEASAPETSTTADDLAYLMYTSGSTGTPKGALNSHAGIRNRLLWMQDAYQLSAEDRVLHKTPINFDPFVWEIFWPLTVGARVVIAKPEGHKDSAYLARTIVDQRVTTMHFVPSMLRRFLADPESASCTGLRRVFCSGEALTADLRDAFFAALPAELYNLYGPTEAAIDVTHFHCLRGTSDPIVPIGRPIANIAIHLLDAAGKPVPIGVPGELHIGGVGVARGYLNRPEATAAAFLADPFSSAPGALLYRTGDLARYRPDGNIEYLGRRDDQVKINGFRIELGEVEAALAQHPGIAECAVVARKDAAGNTSLIAHIVPVAAAPGTAELRRFLLDLIPAAMVPAVFRAGDLLPLSASGKVDRRALLALDQELDTEQTEFVAPRDATEESLAQIWREVLDVERVGVTDDFFALGGASTQALEVAVRVGELGLELRPESLFVYGTIAELAAEFGPIGGQPAVEPKPSAPVEAAPTAPKAVATPVIKPVQTGPARNVVIESLGVYLPPRAVSTEQVLADCVNEVKIPLERLTGIKNRRMAGQDEFSIDLGRKAIADCLSRSSYAPEDIDLVIACNISRCDGPEHMFTFEPSTASQFRDQLGLTGAVCFDINNACAGMFTGVSVAQDFLKTGLVRNALVVSGEYISHITETAQQEIESAMDPRLACLTVGDAGAAAVLELGPNDRVGFHDLDLATFSEFAKLCIAKATEGPHGGAIMVTDSVTQTAIAVKHSVPYVAAVMQRHGWRPETADQLLMHQTSEASINDAILTINRVFGAGAASRANTICNLAERGNTATTTHFVALYDYINAGRINSGDNVVLSITGSGQTIGTGLYTFDDLPDRMRRAAHGQAGHGARGSRSGGGRRDLPATPRVRIEGIGMALPGSSPDAAKPSSIQFATDAAAACLADSGVERTDVGLVIHAGIYRDDFLSEPAVATLVAGEVGINAEPESADAPKTFAFDVLNGAVGFLNGCHVAAGMIGAGRTAHALVLASEVENNAPESGYARNGITEMGSAIMLSPSHGPEGFGRFVFGHHPEHRGALATYTQEREGRMWLRIDRDPNLAAIYVSCLPPSVKELLTLERLEPADIAVVFPPYLPAAALDELAAHIGVDRSRFVDLEAHGVNSDPFTSTLPYQIADARRRGLVKPGDVALIMAVGSGVEVGVTTYRF